MVKKSMVLVFVLLILVTACQPIPVVPTSEPEISTVTETPIPPTNTPVPPTATNTKTPEPTVTPTPLPYYLEGKTLYDLDESSGEYMVISEGVISLETSDEGVLTAFDSENDPLYELIDDLWLAVISESLEYVYLAGNPEEHEILEAFVYSFQTDFFGDNGKEWDFDEVPVSHRLHWVNEDGEDKGEVEYGLLNEKWAEIEDDTWPTYVEDFRFVSGVVLGIENGQMVMVSRSVNGKVVVSFLDTTMNETTEIGITSYKFDSGFVPSDQSPLFYSGSNVRGMSDLRYTELINEYFDEGFREFQVFVSFNTLRSDVQESMNEMWSDVEKNYLDQANGLNGDYGLGTKYNFKIAGITVSKYVAGQIGLRD